MRKRAFLIGSAWLVAASLPWGLMAVGQPQEHVVPLRIMPVGDSITRGTYLGAEKRPSPLGGGWRKPLQDRLRAAGVPFEFVGELDYWAYGADGIVDPSFSPRHHGLAGFSNKAIREGGVVPTPKEILEAKGVKEIRVPGIVEALARNKPDVVLLMSGANGFNANERDLLIRTVCEHFTGDLFVASITPQKKPRRGWEQVAAYNASLPALITNLQNEGHRIHYVDMYAALTPEDISEDGVHPNEVGLSKIAEVWFRALVSRRARPLVGAIRWDAWYGALSDAARLSDPTLYPGYDTTRTRAPSPDPGKEAQQALAAEPWRYRTSSMRAAGWCRVCLLPWERGPRG